MGSLFQLRDFWYTSFSDEEFSASAVTVGDLDNSQKDPKIAIGSFQGNLRIINPSPERGEMQPGDLLLEQKYPEPLLQLHCGPLEPIIDTINRNLLVILFPRRLLMLSIECRGEQDDQGDPFGVYYESITHFETTFDSCAYNFTTGYFGGSRTLMVCVQTMDGQLTVLDHNKVVFRRYISSDQFLLPGCLKYCEEKQYFLTNNSSLFLMCYTYTSLLNSVGSETKDTLRSLSNDSAEGDDNDGARSSAASTLPRLSPAWAFNIGDDVVQIEICSLSRGCKPSDKDVVVLCPYSVHVLNLRGECRMVRRLDVETCCMNFYRLPNYGVDNLVIGCHNGLVNFYSDAALEWSAKLPHGTPISVQSDTLCGTKGMLLVLNSEGTLSVNYLGTDPAENPIQPLESQAAAYGDMVRELKKANWDIKECERTGGDEEARRTYKEDEEDVAVAAAAAAAAEAENASAAAARIRQAEEEEQQRRRKEEEEEEERRIAEAAKAAEALRRRRQRHPYSIIMVFTLTDTTEIRQDEASVSTVSLNLNVRLDEEAGFDLPRGVIVQLQTVAPLELDKRRFDIEELQRGESVNISVTVSCRNDKDSIFPSSVELSAVAVYKGKRRETLAATASCMLPLFLVCHPVPPVKTTGFTVQLNTNKATPPSLLELFNEMRRFEYITVNVLSVRYVNGEHATLLVSKNASRFKLQASTLEALWLLLSELLRRLKLFYNTSEDKDPDDINVYPLLQNSRGNPKNGNDDVFSTPDLSFEIPNEPPLVDFLAVVQTHLSIRKELNDSYSNLERAADFFRAMQKRLIVRFRDTNPSSTDAVEAVFTESYTNLQRATDGVNFSRSRLRQACAMLNCCARLMYVWVAIRYQGTLLPNDRRFLKGILCCDITGENTVGWEEITEAALAQVLENSRPLNKQLEVNYSFQSLKKSITAVFERTRAGQPLIKPKSNATITPAPDSGSTLPHASTLTS